mgnify:CR=1 FL=1
MSKRTTDKKCKDQIPRNAENLGHTFVFQTSHKQFSSIHSLPPRILWAGDGTASPYANLGEPRPVRTFVAIPSLTSVFTYVLTRDFCVVVTATFRLLYVLIVIEHQTRRIVHCNVTAHPTAAWTPQQLREAIPTKNWVEHYNRGRPHSSLGPGIPDPPVDLPVTPREQRHRIPSRCKIVAHPILGGLHHEYGLLAKAA